jgi:hypothetical protein
MMPGPNMSAMRAWWDNSGWPSRVIVIVLTLCLVSIAVLFELTWHQVPSG